MVNSSGLLGEGAVLIGAAFEHTEMLLLVRLPLFLVVEGCITGWTVDESALISFKVGKYVLPERFSRLRRIGNMALTSKHGREH